MRVMGIDHEKERFVRFLDLSEKFGGELAIQFLASPVGHLGTVPTVPECFWLRDGTTRLGLAQYAGHEPIFEQGLGQGRNTRIDLGEAQSAAVVGIPTGHPDRPGGHANGNRHVAVLEAQPSPASLSMFGVVPLTFEP